MNQRVLLALWLSAAAFAETGRDKLAPDLEAVTPESGQDGEIDVIVKYREGAGLMNARKGLGLAARQSLRVKANHELVNSQTITVKRSELAQLAEESEVEYISPDRTVSPTLDRSKAAVMASALISRTGLTGWGVTVAVIDSGLDSTNEAFNDGITNRVLYEKSFVSGVTSTADEYGHGTHVGAILGGDGMGTNYATAPYKGLAPGVNLINLRVLDKNGAGKDSWVISALQWAVANKGWYDIRVINLSLGRPVTVSYKNDPLCQAVEAAWKAGIVVVVAAGNEGRNNSVGNQGYGTITAPGNDPYVITVGASNARGTDTRADDIPTSYTSKGPSMIDHVVKPDLIAPGNRVVAIGTGKLLATYPGNVVDATNKYMTLSGTSMAAPVVTGAVALMLEDRPFLTPDQVKTYLMKNAWRGFPLTATVTDAGQSFTVRNDIFTIGAGYLDIDAAVADWSWLPLGTAQSPTAVFNSSTNKASIVTGTNVVWGTTTLPLNVIWGTNVVWGTNVIWGSNVVWGTSGNSGCNVIWGSTSIYAATSSLNGESSALINGEK